MPIKQRLLSLILLSLLISPGCAIFDANAPLHQRTTSLHPQTGNDTSETLFTQPSLKFVSLNLAHGRKDSFSQLFLSSETISNNLNDIAYFLKTQQADIVAVQEVDAPSNWSGQFHHLDYLAQAADYPAQALSTHVNNLMGSYGTGLLAKASPTESYNITFAPSPPTPRKGFTLASFDWQPSAERKVILDVISLHLDFSRESVRQQQLQDLKQTIIHRNNPTVILGDFNSEQAATVYTPNQLPHLQFTSFQPASIYHNSYNDRRLDWVLISHHLEFVDYETHQVVLSDHKPIITTIKLKAPSTTVAAH